MGCCKKSKTKPKMTREELYKYSKLMHLLVSHVSQMPGFQYYKYCKFVDSNEVGIESKYAEVTAVYGEEEEEKLIKHLEQTSELLDYLIAPLENK